MTRIVKSLFGALATLATSATLACNPPPNLTLQQWYGMCQFDIRAAYQMYGAGIDFNFFAASLYQQYAQSSGIPGVMPTTPYPTTPCSIAGQTACFSGWVMTCNGSQWLTGAERCN